MQEGAAVFRTIEDFMWFMVSLVQFPAASTSGQLRVGPGKHIQYLALPHQGHDAITSQ